MNRHFQSFNMLKPLHKYISGFGSDFFTWPWHFCKRCPKLQVLSSSQFCCPEEGQFLEALDLSVGCQVVPRRSQLVRSPTNFSPRPQDIWVMDDRDDSPERGEWNPDPEEVGMQLKCSRKGSRSSTDAKVLIKIISTILYACLF